MSLADLQQGPTREPGTVTIAQVRRTLIGFLREGLLDLKSDIDHWEPARCPNRKEWP